MQINPTLKCTSCGKEILLGDPQASRTTVWSRGRVYCNKKCILKEKQTFCDCGDETTNSDGVCDTCKLRRKKKEMI